MRRPIRIFGPVVTLLSVVSSGHAAIALGACNLLTGASDLSTDVGAGGPNDGTGGPSGPDGSTTNGSSSTDPGTDGGANRDAAADVDVPDGYVPGKRVFVISSTVTGNFGGVAQAKTECTQAAAGLGGTWMAWVSVAGDDAVDRLTTDGPFRLVDGTLVATNKAALLAGTLSSAINKNERGQTVSGFLATSWTGTGRNGRSTGDDCQGWTSANQSDIATVGSVTAPDGGWTDVYDAVGSGGGCSSTFKLYCFEL
ncbi:Tryptophan synthase alpha chain [Labilithrix luteola]|uniref:Tryptophan synthase alpha chain n=1 Tax=Labilithrix luteola TaxID=1391654 RepID=A0A0K1PWV4_9BACT|nr:hypothetical protein [Labilithrix luteola]AKU98008.1 Tryptophan synthase alpha chain [Labilithrix luteola]